MSDQRDAGQLELVVLDVVKMSKSWTAGPGSTLGSAMPDVVLVAMGRLLPRSELCDLECRR
jgi:hypothetical protein